MLVRVWIPHTPLLGMHNGTATLEKTGAVSHKNNLHLLNGLTILLLGISATEMETYVHTKTCMQMFRAALSN